MQALGLALFGTLCSRSPESLRVLSLPVALLASRWDSRIISWGSGMFLQPHRCSVGMWLELCRFAWGELIVYISLWGTELPRPDSLGGPQDRAAFLGLVCLVIELSYV